MHGKIMCVLLGAVLLPIRNTDNICTLKHSAVFLVTVPITFRRLKGLCHQIRIK